MPRLLVTGANGHLGRRLLHDAPASWQTRALVRSERARTMLGDHDDVHVVDYGDRSGLVEVCAGCDAVAHLVGIIKEGRGVSYQSAHVDATQALLDACAASGVGRIVYLSILGADVDSRHACLASKGEAEALIRQSGIASLVLRIPMVLGEGDYATAALLANARRRVAVTFRASSLEQPIYAGDVVDAMLATLATNAPNGVLELAGPVSLSRRDLIGQASDGRARVLSLPIGAGYAMARLLGLVMANPPVTGDMLGVLDHDDNIDPEPAVRALGIGLTDLGETLARITR